MKIELTPDEQRRIQSNCAILLFIDKNGKREFVITDESLQDQPARDCMVSEFAKRFAQYSRDVKNWKNSGAGDEHKPIPQ